MNKICKLIQKLCQFFKKPKQPPQITDLDVMWADPGEAATLLKKKREADDVQ